MSELRKSASSQKNGAIIANCPLPEVRRQWVTRIAFQDGEREGEGGLGDWLALADAVGLSREEVLDERHVLPGVRFAVDGYVNFYLGDRAVAGLRTVEPGAPTGWTPYVATDGPTLAGVDPKKALWTYWTLGNKRMVGVETLVPKRTRLLCTASAPSPIQATHDSLSSTA